MIEPVNKAAFDGMMGLARRIQDAEASLSANDQTIAALILQDPFIAAFSTAEELARAAGVSKAAVVRFALRLGYGGFTELRQDLRRRWQERGANWDERSGALPHETAGERIEPARSLVTARLSQVIASLSGLVEHLDYATFTRCAELLVRPGTPIHVVGQRRAYAMAVRAHRLFKWLGCDTRLFRTEELGLRLALDEIKSGHIVLALAFRRYPHLTGAVLEYAHERKATTILLAESRDCPYVPSADHMLLCPARGTLLIDSPISAIFCLEALGNLMMQLLGTKVDTYVRRTHEETPMADFEDADQTAWVLRPARGRRQSPARGALDPPDHG